LFSLGRPTYRSLSGLLDGEDPHQAGHHQDLENGGGRRAQDDLASIERLESLAGPDQRRQARGIHERDVAQVDDDAVLAAVGDREQHLAEAARVAEVDLTSQHDHGRAGRVGDLDPEVAAPVAHWRCLPPRPRAALTPEVWRAASAVAWCLQSTGVVAVACRSE